MASQSYITVDGGAPGRCRLDAAKDTPIVLVDATPGPAPLARVWSFTADANDLTDSNPFGPAFPTSLSAAPTIDGSTTDTATFQGSEDGCYALVLRRTESSGATTRQYILIAIPDDEGQRLPAAGLNGALVNTDGGTAKRGWAGTRTGKMLEDFLRSLRGRIKAIEVFLEEPTFDDVIVSGAVLGATDLTLAAPSGGIHLQVESGHTVTIGDGATIAEFKREDRGFGSLPWVHFGTGGGISADAVLMYSTGSGGATMAAQGGNVAFSALASGDAKVQVGSGKVFKIADNVGELLTFGKVGGVPAIQARNVANSGYVTVLERTADDGIQFAGVVRHMSPIGGGADDWPNLIAAVNELAYVGKVVMGPGTWTCNSEVALVSGARIDGNAGARVVQTLAPSGGLHPLRAAFHADNGATGLQTTFTADSRPGDDTIFTVASLSVGSIIRINGTTNPFHAATRVVTAVGGSGPFNVTFDEPLYEFYYVGDFASVLASVPTDIHIDGKGMRMSGTGGRFGEINGGWRCSIGGITVDPDDGMVDEYLFSFDIGSRGCRFYDMDLDCGAYGAIGLVGESNCRLVIERCKVTGATQYGITMFDSNVSTIDECDTFGNAISGIFVGPDGNTAGCNDCQVTRSTAHANGGTGITVDGGSTGTIVSECAASGNATNDLLATTDIVLKEFRSWGTAPHAVHVTGGKAKIDKLHVKTSSADNVVLLEGGTIEVRSSYVEGAAGGNAIANIGASLVVRDSKLVGSSNGVANVGGFFSYSGLDAEGCATPIATSGGGQNNIGTVTLNGATPVDYNFPVRSTDPVVLTRKTAGGTPGPAPTYTVTAGTKVTVTGAAADTSIYTIEIG